MKRPRQRATARKPVNRGDYAVGYGKPPRAHRFKPGRSGNPRGRPKGSKNEATILTELLNRKIEVREGGRSRKVTVLEAMLMKFAEEALRGDPKAATFLLNRYRPPEASEASDSEMNREDQEILDAFTRRIQSQLKEKTS